MLHYSSRFDTLKQSFGAGTVVVMIIVRLSEKEVMLYSEGLSFDEARCRYDVEIGTFRGLRRDNQGFSLFETSTPVSINRFVE